MLLTRSFINPCLDSEDTEEEALYACINPDNIVYEEPDLSGGIEGEDYYIAYGVEGNSEE